MVYLNHTKDVGNPSRKVTEDRANSQRAIF